MWRRIEEHDLTAALSQAEIDAFRTSAEFEHDPVESQLRQTAAYVRGVIRSGGKCRLAPDELTLPESLIAPSMDFLRYNMLTRMDLVVNESRTKAYEMAVKTFDDVRAGVFVPESDGAADETAVPATPGTGKPNPEKRLLD